MPATTQEQKITGHLLEMFYSYDPDTGFFTRKLSTNPRSFVGGVASAINADGYVILPLMGVRLRAHRAAWAWVTGQWPMEDIDHINGDRSDNRFANLREATRSQNLQNSGMRASNKTGYKGVHYCHERRKFVAQIVIDGKRVGLGRYQTVEEAAAVRLAAEKKVFGEFMLAEHRPCFERIKK